MISLIKKTILFADDFILRHIVKALYPQYRRPRFGYMLNAQVILRYAIPQKILRINGKVPWPVDFRSKINGWNNIKKGICCDPGDNIGIYINAVGGITLGNNVNIGPGTSITSTNHDMSDHRKTAKRRGVVIGNNVWIGANCCILAGTTIGDNVTIGAGCVISGEVQSDTIVVNDLSSLLHKPKRPYEWDVLKEKLN